MIEQAIARLDELARADPTTAPLALLQAEALRAAADRAWAEGVPALGGGALAGGQPLLHEQTLRVDPDRAQRLLARLAVTADRSGGGAGSVRRALETSALDSLALLEASIGQDGERLERLAAEADLAAPLLATLGQLACLPLLQAAGQAAAPGLGQSRWERGYCPVCAAWPTLAELRGLERQRWLRCGRCGSGWAFSHVHCPYCLKLGHGVQEYLAPEAAREARRAVVCDECRGYVKTLTTIGAIPPAEIGLQDLATLELDVAALERGYGRPTTSGFPLRVIVEPARRQRGWLAWKR